jgi:hypothetical protein
MSRRWQTCLLCSASIGLLAFATSVFLVGRASTKPSSPTSSKPPQSQRPRTRNLVLQPEATAVNRRLGNRLKS